MSFADLRLAATFSIVALIAIASPSPARAQEPQAKRWVWLERQGVWGYGYQIQDGPHRGLWRIDPDSKRPSEEPESEPEPEPAPTTDDYGFGDVLNRHRASAGLAPLAYDPDLATWAASNNAEQAARGLGHHVNPGCFQNSAWNTPDAQSTADEWMSSAPHRANMLAPGVTRYGIAFGPGPYWTLNAR